MVLTERDITIALFPFKNQDSDHLINSVVLQPIVHASGDTEVKGKEQQQGRGKEQQQGRGKEQQQGRGKEQQRRGKEQQRRGKEQQRERKGAAAAEERSSSSRGKEEQQQQRKGAAAAEERSSSSGRGKEQQRERSREREVLLKNSLRRSLLKKMRSC